MSKHRNLMSVCFAAVFALGLAACSSNDDDTTMMPDTMEPDTMEPDADELTELEKAQAAAAAAATAAMTAAGNASDAADAAELARADAATMQTDETSGGLAKKAREYADAADDAYTDAKAASEAAAEATDVTSAVRAQVDAENAQAKAEAAEIKAVEYGGNSMAAAGTELLIDDTVKRVGDTELDATAGSNVLTVGEGDDAQTTRTGLLEGMAPMTTGEGADTGLPECRMTRVPTTKTRP